MCNLWCQTQCHYALYFVSKTDMGDVEDADTVVDMVVIGYVVNRVAFKGPVYWTANLTETGLDWTGNSRRFDCIHVSLHSRASKALLKLHRHKLPTAKVADSQKSPSAIFEERGPTMYINECITVGHNSVPSSTAKSPPQLQPL